MVAEVGPNNVAMVLMDILCHWGAEVDIKWCHGSGRLDLMCHGARQDTAGKTKEAKQRRQERRSWQDTAGKDQRQGKGGKAKEARHSWQDTAGKEKEAKQRRQYTAGKQSWQDTDGKAKEAKQRRQDTAGNTQLAKIRKASQKEAIHILQDNTAGQGKKEKAKSKGGKNQQPGKPKQAGQDTRMPSKGGQDTKLGKTTAGQEPQEGETKGGKAQEKHEKS
eukprot:gene25802-11475_t